MKLNNMDDLTEKETKMKKKTHIKLNKILEYTNMANYQWLLLEIRREVGCGYVG